MDLPTRYIKRFPKVDFEYSRSIVGQDMPIFHFHDRYEVYYLHSGERQYFIGDRTYHVKPGSLVLINRNLLHRTMAVDNQGCERYLFYYKQSYIEGLHTTLKNADLFAFFQCDRHVLRLDQAQQDLVRTVANKITAECIMGYAYSIEYIEVLFMELLLIINRCLKQHHLYSDQPNPSYQKIAEIVQYMNTNYHHNLTLASVTQKFYISVSTLTKLFREATGFTFVEYLNNLRVHGARYLLEDTDLSISQIAESVGYGSVTHFDRVFKRLSGCTPSCYRKNPPIQYVKPQ